MATKSSNAGKTPRGDGFDLTTKEGANGYLNGLRTCEFFSDNVKHIKELRKKTRLSADDQEKLRVHCGYIEALPLYSDNAIFRAKVPRSEIQVWLDYVIEEIKGFTTNQDWIRTGNLEGYDFRVILSCIYMFQEHVVPVQLAFTSDFFEVLANFIKARKGHGGRALPHLTICGPVGRIVHSALRLAAVNFDKRWPLEKIFKKFEASGILEQILRCATVPAPAGLSPELNLDSQDPMNAVLKSLQACPRIITRKFKIGEPCGDTLKAILDGRDGSRNMQPRILNGLKGIARLVETMDGTTEFVDVKGSGFGQCNLCSKKGTSEAPTSFCSGCRLTRYCSKECQKADWKKHKHFCKQVKKPERDQAISLAMVQNKFLEKNSRAVYLAIYGVCASTGDKAGDLAVEVDFMPNENGVIPAFHEPCFMPDENGIIPAFHDTMIFRIVSIRDYLSGQDMPEWLRGNKVADHRRASFKEMVKLQIPEGGSSAAALVMRHAGNEFVFPEQFKL